jgi:hypothetical protein
VGSSSYIEEYFYFDLLLFSRFVGGLGLFGFFFNTGVELKPVLARQMLFHLLYAQCFAFGLLFT